MSTFREFQVGLQAGQQLKKQNTEEAARAKASAMFGAGDYDGAESAMFGAGLYDEGSALADAGARRTQAARAKTYGDAFRTDGYKGVRDAAGAEGDIATSAAMDEQISRMSADERSNAALSAQFFGNAAYGLMQIKDPAQRQAALMEIVETSGGAFGITPEQAAGFDLSDTSLDQTWRSSLSLADKLTMDRQDQRNEVEDARAERGLGLQERSVAVSEEGLGIARRELDMKEKLARNPPPDITSENTVRGQYLAQTKTFPEVRDAYARVRATRNSPAGDVALVYGIMKMIDPGAAVMEGDIANASNTTGVPGQIMNLYNAVVGGKKLNADQRQDFLLQAQDLYDTAELSYGATLDLYRELAAGSGLNPMRVAPDLRVLQFEEMAGGGGGGAGADGGARPSLSDIFSGGTD
jgi:hypothetical protein